MKKGVVFVLFCLWLAPYAVAEIITGEVVATGEVIASEVGMTISIIGPPSLVILSPENGTYLTTNILLNYSVSGEDAIWYSLDGGSNITLVSSVNLNVGEGAHSLSLYANNSYGVSSKTTVFTVNESKLVIFYGEYNGSDRGESTSFYDISYENLQSLGGIVLEKTSYGKISFDEVINVTDDLNNSDGVVDLDSYINISLNAISIDSAALPNFNKPATLSFYNLSFSDPRVLVNGEVCPFFLCNVIDYSGGIFKFNVSHFTTYSVEETPEDVVVTVPSSGGGGGSSTKIVKELFLIDTDQIGVEVKQGGIVTKKIVVTNKENRNLNVNIRTDVFEDTVIFSLPSFTLGPLESKEILIDFIARENQVPDIYIGKIIVEAEDFEKEIFFSVVVRSKVELFDVSVTIPEGYEEVEAGKNLLSEIELFNLGETGRIDAEIKYFIKNHKGETILFEEEVKAIETSLNFVKIFHIPSDLPSGKYTIYVQVSYADQVIGSSAWFSVVGDGFVESPYSGISNQKFVGYLIATAVIIVAIVFAIKRKGKGKKRGK